jgi:hypothetical protein
MPQGKLLQIQVPVGAGASGAPVLNSRGDVMGVVVAAADALVRVGTAGANQPGVAWTRADEKLQIENGDLQRKTAQLTRDTQALKRQAMEQVRQSRIAERAKIRKQSKDEAERDKREEAEERRMDHLDEELDRQIEHQTEKIDHAAERLGEAIGRRAELLADLQAARSEPSSNGRGRNAAEQQRREAELKRLETEINQQKQSLHQELERLNQTLPAVPGLREIAVDLKPVIAQAVSEAHAATDAAVNSALAAQPAGPMSDLRIWSGHSPGQGASTYAVPADRAQRSLAQLRDHGRVAHAFLGVGVENLKPADAERLKAPPEARVRVKDFAPDSPAREAGVQKDDLILEFQGKKVEDAADLADQIAQASPGERATLVVWRDVARRTIQATLCERPAQPRPQPAFGPYAVPAPRLAPMFPGGAVVPVPASPDLLRVFTSGRVVAHATGNGRSAQVSLEAQDAELEAVTRELSKVTHLDLSAEGDAARRRITLKVEEVPVIDLIDSLEHLFHVRIEHQGEKYVFKSR